MRAGRGGVGDQLDVDVALRGGGAGPLHAGQDAVFAQRLDDLHAQGFPVPARRRGRRHSPEELERRAGQVGARAPVDRVRQPLRGRRVVDDQDCVRRRRLTLDTPVRHVRPSSADRASRRLSRLSSA